jgi:hypothetical protein
MGHKTKKTVIAKALSGVRYQKNSDDKGLHKIYGEKYEPCADFFLILYHVCKFMNDQERHGSCVLFKGTMPPFA